MNTPRDFTRRAEIFTEELSDQSTVYGVRIADDYDFERYVEIDCVDQQSAIALLAAFEAAVSNVEVKTA